MAGMHDYMQCPGMAAMLRECSQQEVEHTLSAICGMHVRFARSSCIVLRDAIPKT